MIDLHKNSLGIVVAVVARHTRALIIDETQFVDNRRRASCTLLRCLDLPRFASCLALRRLALPHPVLPSTSKEQAGIGRKEKEGKRGSKKQEEGRKGGKKRSRKGERGEGGEGETDEGKKRKREK